MNNLLGELIANGIENIIYDGIQNDRYKNPYAMQFTDEITRSAFYARDYNEAKQKVGELRLLFKKAELCTTTYPDSYLLCTTQTIGLGW